MQYSDILSKFYFLSSTNVGTVPLATSVILANNALEHLEALVNNSDERWVFDDTNNTDYPIATGALVANQQDYPLAVSHLTIDRVEILDATGLNWLKLQPFGQHDVRFQALGNFLKAPGTPLMYDKLADSLFLYPIPNYSMASALKIYFTRPPVYFISSDTTKTPGINPLFHDLIAYWMAYEFAMANGKSNAPQLWQAIQLKEQSLYDFYGQRSRDERPRMGVATNNLYGQNGNQSGVMMGGYGTGLSDSNR